ncbi:MAG: hypothetical protein ABIV13_05030, partial [Fimbriimonadales bacterium]
MTEEQALADSRKRKLHGCWKVLLLGVLLVIGCRLLPYKIRGAGPLSLFDQPWNELPFDSTAWKSKELYGMSPNNDPGADMKRGLMLDDLVDEHIRLGMTMDLARELLGEPDSPGNSGRRWTYELGMWSGFRFEMDFLVLRFDEEGRLF